MAATTEEAVYRLGWQSDDTVLTNARNKLGEVASAADAASVSEEKLSTATRTRADSMDRLLGKLDPTIRAQQQLAATQARIQQLQEEGIGTQEQYTQAMNLAEQKYTSFNTASTKLEEHFLSVHRLTRELTAGFAAVQAFRFAENIINNIDSIRDKAHELGIAVDSNVVDKIQKAQVEWEKAWIHMQLAAAPLIDRLAALPQALAAIPQILWSRMSFADIQRMQTHDQATASGIPFAAEYNPFNIDQRQLAIKAASDFQSSQAAERKPYDEDQWRLAHSEMQKFLDEQKLTLELTRETADQRDRDLIIIRAANAALKDQGLSGAVNISSVSQARAIVGPGGVAQIGSNQTAMDMATAAVAFQERLRTASTINDPAARLGVTVDLNATHAEVQKSIDLQESYIRTADRRAGLEAKYLDDLRFEVTLEGMTTQKRAEELELLKVKDKFGETFATQNEAEIRLLIEQKQHLAEINQLHDRWQSDFEGFLKTVETGGSGGFKKLFTNILSDWEDMLNKMAAEKLFQQIFGGENGGGILAILSGVFAPSQSASQIASIQATGASFGADAFAGGFASGGYIGPGQFGMTGERGPELIYGGRTGATVVPNANSGPTVNVYQNISVHPDVSAIARGEVAKVAPMIAAQAVAAVRQAARRGQF